MKRPVFLVFVFLIAATIAACAPATLPPTPTAAPTAVPPTVNAQATEAVIISHVFATMTASAPAPTAVPVFTPSPTLRPTTAPTRPRTVVRATNTPAPPGPPPASSKPTGDPFLAQIPPGMGGILVVSYVGDREVNFTITNKLYPVPPNGKTLIVLAPGDYPFSVRIPVIPGAGWSDSIEVTAGRYQTYPVSWPRP